MTKITTKHSKKQSKLSIQGDMTIQHVSKIKKTMIELFEKTGDIEFDFERVNNLDITGFQLLCSVCRASLEQGKKIRMVGKTSSRIAALVHNFKYLENNNCILNKNGECFQMMGGKS